MHEIYISTDVETDGPIPGPNSMLSLGAAAYSPEKKLLGTFSANLELLEGAAPDAATMNFWNANREAYEKTRSDLRSPAEAMAAYVAWVKSFPGRPVFVGYLVGFDFLFVYWYMIRFAGTSPFSFSAVDIKTYAMAMMGAEYRKSTKREMPKHWFDPMPHTHVAVEDAIEQGALFCNMLRENLRRLGKGAE